MAVVWKRIEAVKKSLKELASDLEVLAADCYTYPYLERFAPLIFKLRQRLAWFEAILMETLARLEDFIKSMKGDEPW